MKTSGNEENMVSSPPRRIRLNDSFFNEFPASSTPLPLPSMTETQKVPPSTTMKPSLRMRNSNIPSLDFHHAVDATPSVPRTTGVGLDYDKTPGPPNSDFLKRAGSVTLSPPRPAYRRKTSQGFFPIAAGSDDERDVDGFGAGGGTPPPSHTLTPPKPHRPFLFGVETAGSTTPQYLYGKENYPPGGYSVDQRRTNHAGTTPRSKYPMSPNPFSPHYSPHVAHTAPASMTYDKGFFLPSPPCRGRDVLMPLRLNGTPLRCLPQARRSPEREEEGSDMEQSMAATPVKSFDDEVTLNTMIRGSGCDERMSTDGNSVGGDTTILTPPTPAMDRTGGEFNLYGRSRLNSESDDGYRIPPPLTLSYEWGSHSHSQDSSHYKGISPTDVLSLPLPPATPYKGKQSHGRTPSRGEIPQVSAHSRFEEDFDVIGTLGTGSFGSVYKVMSKMDGCMYAIKVVKRKVRGVASREIMLREVYALAALCDQPDPATFHIVRYHQAWMENCQLYIQTELCDSTLHQEMTSHLTEKRRYKLLREMLLALDLLHRNAMVHLDIKPENIFIRNDQYKLGDFGLVNKTTTVHVEEGDSRYMSLELLSHTPIPDLTKCDIFSLGATLYEASLGQSLPASGDQWQNLRHDRLGPLPHTSEELRTLIANMMQFDSFKRPTAKHLLGERMLLSDEQKMLITERNKVEEANRALEEAQAKIMKGMNPPRGGKLIRRSTWDVGMIHRCSSLPGL